MASPLEDEELWNAVRAIVREETADLVATDRVTITERLGPVDESVSGGIKMKPANPGAAPLHLDVWGDTVGFGPGPNGAHFEIWTTADPDWDETLRELIRCVRAGSYSERVWRGWVFALKIRMRFSGVVDAKGRTYTPLFASLPDPETGFEVGEHRYAAW